MDVEDGGVCGRMATHVCKSDATHYACAECYAALYADIQDEYMLLPQPQIGDVVVYTTARLTARAAIVAAVNENGTLELCCLDAATRSLEWHSGIARAPVLAAAGTEEAAGYWVFKSRELYPL
jgi:hypothetical protein